MNDFFALFTSATWCDILPQSASGSTILTEGISRTGAGTVNVRNIRQLLATPIDFKFPFGSALNIICDMDTLFTGC